MELDYSFWNYEFQQYGSPHLYYSELHLVEDHMHDDFMVIAMGENDSEDQTESVPSSEELIAYRELNHESELQEADASSISNTCIILPFTTPDNAVIYIIVIVVLLI